MLSVPVEDESAESRDEHHLVGIDDEAVGSLESGQQSAMGVAERRRGAASPATPSSLTVLRGGSFTAADNFGNGSTLFGSAIASTKSCWKCGSSAVSIFSIRFTVCSISRR